MTLVDTSSWIEALRKSGDPIVRERVRTLILRREAAVCDMVMLELWNGARGEAERKALAEMESTLPMLAADAEVWKTAKTLAARSRSRGITVPSTDLLIVAIARRHGADLEHRDSHFDSALAL